MMTGMRSGSRAVVIGMTALTLAVTAASPLRARADAGVPATIDAAGQNQNATVYADGSDKGKDGKKSGKDDKGGSEPIIISPPIITKDPPKKDKKG